MNIWPDQPESSYHIMYLMENNDEIQRSCFKVYDVEDHEINETIVKNIPCDEAEDSDAWRDLIGYHLGLAVAENYPKHDRYYYSISHRWFSREEPVGRLAPSALWHVLYRISAMQGYDHRSGYMHGGVYRKGQYGPRIISTPQKCWHNLTFCVRSVGAPTGWTFSKDALDLNHPYNHEAQPCKQQRTHAEPELVQSMLEIVRQMEEVNYNANCYYNFPDDGCQMLDADYDQLDDDLTANIVKFHKLWLATRHKKE